MEVTLYNFSKRENSTKQPSGGTTISGVRLKADTSLYSPSIEFSTDISNYNYMKWDNRYYYVDDITYSNGLYIANCEIDELATWKNEIGNVSAFKRYASSGYDIGIIDPRLSSDPNALISTNSAEIFGNASRGYVITYVGEHGSGGNPCVAVSESGIEQLMTAIQSNPFAELLNDPQNAVSKILTDTASAITSCKYVPIIYTSGQKQIVLAGGYDTGLVGSAVEPYTGTNVTIPIGWNFANGDFRNRSQFTTILVYLPGYGYMQLNTDDFIGKSSITFSVLIDSVNGGLVYDIGGVAKAECNIGTAIQISTVTQGNAPGAIVSGLGAVGGIATGNPLVALGGAFGAVLSSMSTNVGSVGSMGTYGGWYLKGNDINVIVISHDTNVDPSSMTSNYGRPVSKVASISEGYNECVNASVNCNAPQSLKDRINSYLNGGFYYE